MAELFKVNAPVRKPLFEGVQGENEARSIQFDVTPWVEELGDGAVTATAKRSQDSQPYPVTVTKDGNTVTWKPTSTDTAFAGVGSFQLEYTVDDVLAKTCIWSTMVAPSLDPAGDPPDPYDNWLADMREVAAEALQHAQDAEQSADGAETEKFEAEAWAKGTKNGTPVSSSDAQYQKNAKYYSEESYKNAEAWAVGQRGGVDVPSTDPTYENNAKYWAEQSAANQYGAYPLGTASGSVASFNDGADNIPMKSLKVAIVPKQAGSGDPSPSNVRPISGWTDADVFVGGHNYADDAVNGIIDAQGADNAGAGKRTPYVPVNEGDVLKVETQNSEGGYRYVRIAFYDSSQVFKSMNTNTTVAAYATFKKTVTIPSGVAFVRVSQSSGTIQKVCTGHTTPVPLGQTVYGGEVNPISGELKITHALFAYDGGSGRWWGKSSTYTGSFYTTMGSAYRSLVACTHAKNIGEVTPSTYVQGTCGTDSPAILAFNIRIAEASTTQEEWKQYLAEQYENGTPLCAVFELATPTIVQLTPAQVVTMLGTNNVWSDAGDVTAEYRKDPTIALANLEALILENI